MTEEPNTETTAVIRHFFQEQSDNLVKGDQTILVSHFGVFSQNLVASLTDGIENLIVSIGDKRIVVKRMFSILIEGLQNLRLHGGLDSQGVQSGFLILANDNKHYRLVLANIVNTEDVPTITRYIESINGYSKDELKEKYTSVLSNEFLSDKGGAGLGLITTRMKSGNRLDYELPSVDDEHSLFVLKVSLDRQ
ncbi:MAG: SiaB family protein kinase [Crocinitomicaceae bacterium]|nr:SiaB family protein kinase [Crocinitomicaceae bacterium]